MRAMVIDGFSLICRAFYALPLLTTSDGIPSGALHGLASTLQALEKHYPTEYLAVALDRPEPTFRLERYPEYKGTRERLPEDLVVQFDLVREMLHAWNIPIVEAAGFEADDILGTLAKRFSETGVKTLLVTGDRDSFQLIEPQVTVLYSRAAGRGGSGGPQFDEIDEQAIMDKYGVKPKQLIDIKALMGDSSDNIPGVPQVGEKTAMMLIQRYATLEEALQHPDEVRSKKARENMVTYAEQARLSYWLATIDCAVPMSLELDDLRRRSMDITKLTAFCRRYQLNRVLASLPQESVNSSGQEMLSLFDMVVAQETPAGEQVELAEFLEILSQSDSPAITWNATGAPWRAEQAQIALATENCMVWLQANGVSLLSVGQALTDKTFSSWRLKELGHLVQSSFARANDYALVAYLLDPGKEPQLPNLYEEYAADQQRVQCAAEVQPAVQLAAVIPGMKAKLAELELDSLYRDVELPLVGVLRGMEHAGIRVDTVILRGLGEEFAREMQSLEQQVHEAAGEPFNLNSPKQLGSILFEKLGLPGGKKTKTGYSTSADVLESLVDKHDIVAMLLRYRTLAKLQGTYIDGMIPLVESDGQLRTTFHQTVAATGRLSSSDPNLQNIPIRQPEGRMLRKAFLPSTSGWQLICADYSQIELRILAHLSQDERFIDAYHQRQDIHRRTAAEVFGVPLDEVTSMQRSQAKAVNFGVVYGISDYGLATQLGISRTMARDFIARFFERYPGIRIYQERLIEEARALGYVTTLFNRRRYLPEIHSRNYSLRSYAERTALNTPIQGSAADLIKIAMIRLEEALAARRAQGGLARLLLQVHDDLLCEAPASETEAVVALMRETMESAIALQVPLEVDIGTASNWYEVKS